MAVSLEQPGIHQWGSYPAATLEQGLQEVTSTVGEYLVFGMPDCEINTPNRFREDWVVGNLKLLADTPGIVTVKDGDYSGYKDFPTYDIGPEGLDSFDLDLGYFDMAKETLPYIIAALKKEGLEDMPIQVGIPGYRQIPTFAFGQYKALRSKYLQNHTIATRGEMFRLAKDADLAKQGLGIQLEYPVETLAVLDAAKKSRRLGTIAAKYMARGIAGQAGDLPQALPKAVHPCYGRYLGEAADAPDPDKSGSYEPVVTLINETLSQWPDGHEPPRIFGFPVIPEGRSMPSKKAQREIVAQLGDLALPKGTVLAPGIVTQHTKAREVAILGNDIQDKIGSPIAIAAPCGLASLRKQPGAALGVLRQEREAVEMLRTA
jgi:hypothetical protein